MRTESVSVTVSKPIETVNATTGGGAARSNGTVIGAVGDSSKPDN
ncbi:MAG TPA: hypothetical protein VEV84_10405 [Pyrinomonadaceae bacterium]|nr:hypothetical protein [Pyrinomonadaceae bacterium]